MKKLLLTAVTALVIVGAGVLSVRHYNQYQTYKNNTVEAAASAEADAVAQAKSEAAVVREQFRKLHDQLRVECEKGLEAYESLTSFEKKSLEKPQCGKVLVQ